MVGDRDTVVSELFVGHHRQLVPSRPNQSVLNGGRGSLPRHRWDNPAALRLVSCSELTVTSGNLTARRKRA
jgi:hypothetical protein